MYLVTEFRRYARECRHMAAICPNKQDKDHWNQLSRDSLFDQRIDVSLGVQGGYGGMDGAIQGLGVSKGLVGQMMRFEIVPDNLDVVEFGGILGQPFDGEPMSTVGKGSGRGLAHV